MTAALLRRPPDWTELASCADPRLNPSWWHSDRTDEQLAARTLCDICPVQYECLIDALLTAEPDGIRGGLDTTDRRRLAPQHGYPRPGGAAHGTRSRYVGGCTDGPNGRACPPCLRSHADYEHHRRITRRTRRADRSGTIHRPRTTRRHRPPSPGQLGLLT